MNKKKAPLPKQQGSFKTHGDLGSEHSVHPQPMLTFRRQTKE
jgi:hypothetical protein